jgi:hypothetical protein
MAAASNETENHFQQLSKTLMFHAVPSQERTLDAILIGTCLLTNRASTDRRISSKLIRLEQCRESGCAYRTKSRAGKSRTSSSRAAQSRRACASPIGVDGVLRVESHWIVRRSREAALPSAAILDRTLSRRAEAQVRNL